MYAIVDAERCAAGDTNSYDSDDKDGGGVAETGARAAIYSIRWRTHDEEDHYHHNSRTQRRSAQPYVGQQHADRHMVECQVCATSSVYLSFASWSVRFNGLIEIQAEDEHSRCLLHL